jgi:hypothetical protein
MDRDHDHIGDARPEEAASCFDPSIMTEADLFKDYDRDGIRARLVGWLQDESAGKELL